MLLKATSTITIDSEQNKRVNRVVSYLLSLRWLLLNQIIVYDLYQDADECHLHNLK